MTDIFAEAARYTMDRKLQSILEGMAKGIFPPKMSMEDGCLIYGTRSHTIPSDPMQCVNLIHTLLTSKPGRKGSSMVETSSRRDASKGFHMDALYNFSHEEACRLGMGRDHAMKIWGLIFSSIYLDEITPHDVHYKDGNIVSIDRIDTSVPELLPQ